MLFDADIAEFIFHDEPIQDSEAIDPEEREVNLPDVETIAMERNTVDPPPRSADHSVRQIAFVDVTINDFETLLEDLDSNGEPLEIVFLDPTRDGFAQIANSSATTSSTRSILCRTVVKGSCIWEPPHSMRPFGHSIRGCTCVDRFVAGR